MKYRELLELLKSICSKPEFALLHGSCENLLLINDSLLKLKANNREIGENQLRRGLDTFYTFNEDHYNQIVALILEKQGHKENTNNLFSQLEQIVTKIKTSTDTKKKYIIFFKAFFEYESALKFLYDFIRVSIYNGHKAMHKYKVTTLSLNLGSAILNFIIVRISYLSNVFKCFSYIDSSDIKGKDKEFIIKLATFIFSDIKASASTSHAFFKSLGITNATISVYIHNHFKQVFLKEYSNNKIYIAEVKNIIAQYLLKHEEEEDNDDLDPQDRYYNAPVISLGYFLLDYMINQNIFIEKEEILNKSKYPIHLVEAEPSIVKEVTTTKEDMRFLLQNQLYLMRNKTDTSDQAIIANNIERLIHDNPRINLKIKDESYLYKFKPATKLSIDLDYLMIFLAKLHKGLTYQDLCSLYDVDTKLLNGLLDPSIDTRGFLGQYITHIFELAGDFGRVWTAPQMRKQIDKVEEQFITVLKKQMGQPDADQLMLSQFQDLMLSYKPLLYDLVNKIFQRKHQLIILIQQAIQHSIFKYFICMNYFDSRGRGYISGVALNIFNNPLAKLFVKLYDENEGQMVQLDDIQNIIDCLKFPQTKRKVKELSNLSKESLRDTQVEYIYRYITSYLDLDLDSVKHIIQENDDYYKDRESLLEHIRGHIKKHKRLFYVHSLICYEQARYRNVHNRMIINYYQKDASSSGLQMLAILFRNPKMATVANLMGNSDYNIYSKATTRCFEAYKYSYHFVQDGLLWFNAHKFLQENHDLKMWPVTQEYYNTVLARDNNRPALLHILATIDFNQSVITRDLLNHLKEEILKDKQNLNLHARMPLMPHLPKIAFDIINTYEKDFKEENITILEYLICLRYYVRITYVVENMLKISMNDPNAIWFQRDLTKHHIMTSLYMSTSYGRKESYLKLLKEKYLISYKDLPLVNEFVSFLEKVATEFINSDIEHDLLSQFTYDACNHMPIIIENNHFKITIDPKIMKHFQISCTSSTANKRGPQLVLKEKTKETDIEKALSMFAANLAHSMDSNLMHIFVELCMKINNNLRENKDPKRKRAFCLIFEKNHDCFILNIPPLLDILLEEAYLLLSNQDNLSYITTMPPDVRLRYAATSVEYFVSLLNPINPYFIK